MAVDSGPLGLCVDGEGGGGIFGPDLVDVGLIVILEEGVVEGDAVIWAQGS